MGTDELLALICVGGPMLATAIWTAAPEEEGET